MTFEPWDGDPDSEDEGFWMFLGILVFAIAFLAVLMEVHEVMHA